MEDNKYYTPAIEEFHVGFEFEFKSRHGINNDWEKKIADNSFFNTDRDTAAYPCMLEVMYPDADVIFRVPYLTKEDIESDEFKLILWDGRFIFRKPTKSDRNFEEVTELLFNPNNNWVLIYSGSEETPVSDFKTRFAGTIKNKSEFKKILKMIGI